MPRKPGTQEPREFDATVDFGMNPDTQAPENGTVTLRVEDRTSGTLVVEITMPFNQFALATTGRANRPCSVKVYEGAQPLWGHTHENKRVVVPGLTSDTWNARNSITAVHLGFHEPGWEQADIDFGSGQDELGPNHHRLVYEDGKIVGYEVHLHRYVDVDGQVVTR